ncbi:MAG: hypothetical protein Q8N47_04265 [Bryobacterales bacterium]|nr:hypothetical protein [Bryobacterales bacterium]
MPATTHLHQLLDQVPESDLPTVERIIAALAGDDEPISPELERRILEAAASIDRGEGITTEQLNRELGL